MVQKNPKSNFILKDNYPHCGKFCFTFGLHFWGLGTKRKVGKKKKEVIGSLSNWSCLSPKKILNKTRQAIW
jgi:hypothetical protein